MNLKKKKIGYRTVAGVLAMLMIVSTIATMFTGCQISKEDSDTIAGFILDEIHESFSEDKSTTITDVVGFVPEDGIEEENEEESLIENLKESSTGGEIQGEAYYESLQDPSTDNVVGSSADNDETDNSETDNGDSSDGDSSDGGSSEEKQKDNSSDGEPVATREGNEID